MYLRTRPSLITRAKPLKKFSPVLSTSLNSWWNGRTLPERSNNTFKKGTRWNTNTSGTTTKERYQTTIYKQTNEILSDWRSLTRPLSSTIDSAVICRQNTKRWERLSLILVLNYAWQFRSRTKTSSNHDNNVRDRSTFFFSNWTLSFRASCSR